MPDEPSWEDLFGPDQGTTPTGATSPTPPGHEAPAAARRLEPAPDLQHLSRRDRRRFEEAERERMNGSPPPPPRRRRRWGALVAVLVVLALLAGGGGYVWSQYSTQIIKVMGWGGPNDYTGTGDGQPASITIVSGQVGSDIATSLYKAGVTKSYDAFYQLLLKTPATFEPGTYKLQKQMSAKAALAVLTDPKNRVISKVVLPEGYTLKQMLARLSSGTGVPLSDFQAAAKNYTALGVPKSAPSLEGFLFPATYEFDPGLSARQILQRLVDRMNQSLDAAGVAASNRLHVLTLASIIQKEGGSTKDFYKVARVFQNRLDKGMLLQSDATVSYGAGSSRISTTDAQRADAANKYNTYVHVGLPIGPIAAPGDAAIAAALHPAAGPWLYFVLVNGYTGQTVFSTTLAQHNAAVLQWQAWLRAHPNYDK
nr:endolytic transglycosylase MltG [Galbitalea soli]